MNVKAVSHRAILDTFALLNRVNGSASVNGNKEVLAINGLVFTLSLAGTIVHDEYDGFYLRTINPAVGELDVIKLSFAELNVSISTGDAYSKVTKIDRYNADTFTGGLGTRELEKAIRNHIAAFTGR